MPKKTALVITGHGGDYLVAIKDNQRGLHRLAQDRFRGLPDEWVGAWEKDHGRIERRSLARIDLDEDISPFPGARQLVRSTRQWTDCADAAGARVKTEVRYFITSLEREQKCAALLAQAIRGHWSVENRNHWRRDTGGWKEGASRPRKKASAAQVLALLRGAVLRLFDCELTGSLDAAFDRHFSNRWSALRLLRQPPPLID